MDQTKTKYDKNPEVIAIGNLPVRMRTGFRTGSDHLHCHALHTKF